MREKIRVGVLFGGRSAEHEVSVVSARSVLQALDRDRYEVTMIGITREGQWLAAADAARVLQADVVEGDDMMPVVLDHHGRGQLVLQSGTGQGIPELRSRNA